MTLLMFPELGILNSSAAAAAAAVRFPAEGGAPSTERIASQHNHLHCLISGKEKKVCSVCCILQRTHLP